jgi:hypothetical protein
LKAARLLLLPLLPLLLMLWWPPSSHSVLTLHELLQKR